HYTQQQSIHSNIEIKPSKGVEHLTGRTIALQAQKLWNKALLPPLLSSFSKVALQSALDAAPALPRALLIEGKLPNDWEYQLRQLQCVGINLDSTIVTHELSTEILHKGYALTVWTVNDLARAQELLRWGCHGIITDAITTINPGRLKEFLGP